MFHSEYGQDSFVASLLPHRNGVFVEFGALDGILHSNSLYFERELGWTGLLIEANPAAYAALIVNRPRCAAMHAAVYDRIGEVEFEAINGGLFGWSGIASAIEDQHWQRIAGSVRQADRCRIKVPCMTLDYALKSAGLREIDYMSIDVEGAEEAILSVFPFADYRIRVLQVENNFGNRDLDALILANGFRFIRRIGPDYLYASELLP
jgi:FkbM family methyltransferase